ncbi:MAG: UDP-N-acetylmuramate--L-alanine ligase [Patescibacteria group bacterium]
MKRYLIAGAGGAGVSNIAQILLQAGNKVAGFDKIKNAATANLESLGIPIFLESEVDIENYDVVFRSAAIKDDHPVIASAIKQNKIVISRYELFQELSESRDVVAIAGSSGKTSTTGLTSFVLQGDRDCGFLVGIHGNGGHFGNSKEFVLEADEYAKTFLHLSKIKLGIITGLKYDHVDIYPTKKDYDEAFLTFASRVEKLIINGDDQYLVQTMSHLKPITFGKGVNCDWRAIDIDNFEGGSTFAITFKGQQIANVKLQVIGGHNIINALAGFVANYELGVEVGTIVERLSQFKGLPRRVELLRSQPYFVYDDYAHLPGEIDTVLRGLRESFPKRRIVCLFQGHTYTRINAFFEDYPKALSNCDVLYLTDIYAARDASGSVDLQKMLDLVSVPTKFLSGSLENSKNMIKKEIKDGDVLIFLNAGNATELAHYFANL